MATRNNKKIALSVLALGGATAAVVFGSWAAWTAQTTNPGNQVTAGRLTLGNDKDAAAILTTNVTDVQPGDTSSDTVTITNTGSVPMDVTLSQSGVTDALSDGNNVLKFTIFDADTGDCVYPAGTGACPALDDTTLGADWNGVATLTNFALPGEVTAEWAAGENHTFTVTWEYTDDGVVNNTNNVVAARTADFDLTWNGVPA
jgi:predicted ribosomally synthesized peptide with SipW-like signal peptide